MGELKNIYNYINPLRIAKNAQGYSIRAFRQQLVNFLSPTGVAGRYKAL